MESAKVDKEIKVDAGLLLADSLEAERELTANLLKALKEEQASMLAGRLEDLYTACRRRTELVEQVRSGQEATAEAIASLLAEQEEGETRTLAAAIARAERAGRPRLRRLQGEINRLRREVAALSKENAQYATEALDYLDAALNILTGGGGEPPTYGERQARPARPTVISSEV